MDVIAEYWGKVSYCCNGADYFTERRLWDFLPGLLPLREEMF
jgi:hypothetical protein